MPRTKALIEYRANLKFCQDRILKLIASGSEDLVEIILLPPPLNSLEFLVHGLVKAAPRSSLRNTLMLLLRWADVNFGQGDALKTAVKESSQNKALVILIYKNSCFLAQHGILKPKDLSSRCFSMLTDASRPRMSKNLVSLLWRKFKKSFLDRMPCIPPRDISCAKYVPIHCRYE
jgi:hypothetical protein